MATFWFQSWFQLPTYWQQSDITNNKKQTTNRASVIPTQPMQSYGIQGTILDWVSDDKAKKIVDYVKSTAKTKEEETLMLRDLHQEAIKYEQKEAYNKEREMMKTQLMQEQVKTKDTAQKQSMDLSLKIANFSDIIREWALKEWVDLSDMNDEELIAKHIQANPNQQQMFLDYVNWEKTSVDVGREIWLIAEEVPVVEEDKNASSIWEFLLGKTIDTSREVWQFLDPLGRKWTGGADVWTALNLVWKSLLNIIPNVSSFVQWVGSMIFHPRQTVEGLKSMWQGIIDQSQWETDTPQAQMVAGMWDSIKETVTDPQKLGEWITQNPADILMAVSPKTAATLGKAVIKWTAEWVVKWAEVLGKWTAKASEFVASQAFGINPSTIRNIIKDPALYNQVEKWVINSEELLSSLGTKIDQNISKLSETGKWYQEIKKIADITPPNIVDVLGKRWITIDKWWKLNFSNTNMADTADLNAIQKAYNMIAKDYTSQGGKINVINTRGKLDDLINYESKTTSKWQSVIKEIRNAIDTKAKSEIPWLAELDASYWEQTKLLKSIKKDFLNPDWTFKDNAMSKISNLTKKWNEAKLERVKELIPWIEDNINAIRAFEDVTLAGWQKVWTYLRWAWTVGVWAMAGWPIWAIVWLLLTSPQVATNLLKGIWYSKQFINRIVWKIKIWSKITTEEMVMLEKWVESLSSKEINGTITSNIDNSVAGINNWLLPKVKETPKLWTTPPKLPTKNESISRPVVRMKAPYNSPIEALQSPEMKAKRAEANKKLWLWKVTKTSNNLYHTTSAENIDSIIKEWLTPWKKQRFEWVWSKDKLSFGANEATASYYGKDWDVMIRTKTSYKPKTLDIDLLAGWEWVYTVAEKIPVDMLEIKVWSKWIPLKDYKRWLSPKNESIPQMKATLKSPEEPLIAEARKYKSAEEFIEWYKNTYYRASDEPFNPSLMKTSGKWWYWTYMTKDKAVAQEFTQEKYRIKWKWEREIENIYISPDARVLEYKDLPNNLKYPPNWTLTFEKIKELWWVHNAQNEMVKYAKKQWYDIFKLWENNDVLINADVVKTESQLKQIREEANKTKWLNPKK